MLERLIYLNETSCLSKNIIYPQPHSIYFKVEESSQELLQLAEEAARGGQNRQQLLRAGGQANVQCRGRKESA